MIIFLDIFTRPETVILFNIMYVSEFLTNIIALNLFAANKVHFDSFISHIHMHSNIVFHIYYLKKHYTFTKAYNYMALVSTFQVHAVIKKT